MNKDEVLLVMRANHRMHNHYSAGYVDSAKATSEVIKLYAKLARVEALADQFEDMERGADVKADVAEAPEHREWFGGYSEAVGDCLQKLREAIGEKEAG